MQSQCRPWSSDWAVLSSWPVPVLPATWNTQHVSLLLCVLAGRILCPCDALRWACLPSPLGSTVGPVEPDAQTRPFHWSLLGGKWVALYFDKWTLEVAQLGSILV